MGRFGRNPFLRSLGTYLFIAANIVSIILVAKIWEAADELVALSKVKLLMLGLSSACVSYLCPLALSPFLIKALFPRLWRAARNFQNGNDSMNNPKPIPTPCERESKAEAHALTGNQRARFAIICASYVMGLAAWIFIIVGTHQSDRKFLSTLAVILGVSGLIGLLVIYHLMRHSPPK